MNTNSHTIRILVFTLIALSLFGVFDTTYLTAQHFSGGPVACGLVEGCELVLSSKYAEIAGISLSAVGLLYYAILLILSLVFYTSKNKRAILLATLLSGFGFLFSLYLVYLQLVAIKAICLYCMVSASLSTGIFVLSFSIYKSIKNEEN